MANLVEAGGWEDGVYQLETSDPVMGGPEGVDNRQAKQLANRTRYLKAQQEAHAGAVNPHPQYQTANQVQALVTAAINALVAAAPGSLDTLKELADALGDDPNFATTMTNALAKKASLDSPEFTGTPKVPTRDLSDNSLAAASTAFVNALLAAGFQSGGKINAVNAPNLLPNGSGEFGNFGWSSSVFGGVVGVGGEGSLFSNGAAINSATYVSDVSSPIAVHSNVPLTLQGEIFTPVLTKGNAYLKLEAFDIDGKFISTVCSTAAISAVNNAFQFLTATGVTPAGTEQVKVSKVLDGSPVAAVAGVRYRRIKLEAGTKASINSGEASIAALSSFFAGVQNPYIKFPNGLILQFGTTQVSNASATVTVTFPIAFPNGCQSLVMTDTGVAGYSFGPTGWIGAKTTFQFVAKQGATQITGGTGVFWALGY
ncbi:hypothetical protein PQQ75_01035 [Paraburkholderia aspalathi]|jgi:hypothetical protein|uniref:gp53-like domain-containing protein n=1 Tax=Paraburkholderia aspalathi TaxID=1324617 RepID=UPI0038B85428